MSLLSSSPLHPYGRLALYRAFVFACSTSRAFSVVHNGPFHFLARHWNELYRIVRAGLIANQTCLPPSPCQTKIFVHHSRPELERPLLLRRKGPYGSGGAYLAAEVTFRFAGPYAGDEPRSPKGLEPSLKDGGLEPSGRADPHTCPTADAPFQELSFRKRVWRSYEVGGIGRPSGQKP